MTVEQDFLPFAIGGSANVETQSEYAADPLLSTGNVAGVAKSSFVNKSIRQANAMVSQLGAFLASNNNTDVLDNGNTAQLLALLVNAFDMVLPQFYTFTSGTGTFKVPYLVQTASCNATAGAVYQDGASNQVTVIATVSGAVQLQVNGTNPPATGTGGLQLSKVSGTGDATITYYAVRTPLYMRVKAIGAGGGGGGNSNGGTAPTAGTNTTFGSFLTAGGASAVANGEAVAAAGGVPTLTTSATVLQIRADNGGRGNQFSASAYSYNRISGGSGAAGPVGGAGCGGPSSAVAAQPGQPNTGSGGGGQGCDSGSIIGGTGGSAGAYIECIVLEPTGTYAYSIGVGGTGGQSGAGGSGGSGFIEVEVCWQ
jgi:hypothetical protein